MQARFGLHGLYWCRAWLLQIQILGRGSCAISNFELFENCNNMLFDSAQANVKLTRHFLVDFALL